MYHNFAEVVWIFVVLTLALDFGLTYARRGELLDYIKRLGCFDDNCTRFYVAEVIEALEYLHSIGIIHRYYVCIFHCLVHICSYFINSFVSDVFVYIMVAPLWHTGTRDYVQFR